MLFSLSSTLEKTISQSPSAEIVDALQHLAESRRRGTNEIVADRSVFNAISKCSDLSKSARSVYQRLFENSTQTYGLIHRASVHVFVTEDPSTCRLERFSNCERIVLSIEYLARHPDLTRSPILLCENLNDCEFWNHVGVFFARKEKLPDRVILDHRNGGGSTTANVYKFLLKGRQTFCLCITDSDHKYKGGSMGDTANELVGVASKHTTALAKLLVIDCQEVENLVPASVLEDLYAKDNAKLDAAKAIRGLQEGSTDLWRYLDVKNGIRVFEYVESTNAEFQKAWLPLFGPVKVVKATKCVLCLKRQDCSDKAHCSSYLAKGCGSSVLSDTVDNFLKVKKHPEISRRVKTPLLEEWLNIGRYVWSWGTAGSAIVT